MILGIDTSSEISSLALGDKVIVWEGNRNQSKDLLVKIDQLVRSCGVKFQDLTGVAVVNGPGSYTGIRIGVSCANTIAMVLGVTVRGVDALRAQLNDTIVGFSDGEVLSVISAGGLRIYLRKYRLVAGKILADSDYQTGEITELIDRGKNTKIVAEANEQLENWLKSEGYCHIHFLSDDLSSSRAKTAVEIFSELGTFENNVVIPLYLRGEVRKDIY